MIVRKQKLSKIFFEVAVISLFVITCGCDSHETLNYIIFPGTKVYNKHLDTATPSFYDNPEWWNYSTLTYIKKRVIDYLITHREIDSTLKQELEKLTITKGMNGEQVSSVVGQPTKKIFLRKNHEIWFYKGERENELPWYYKWAKLTFQNDKLIDIEVQRIYIPK